MDFNVRYTVRLGSSSSQTSQNSGDLCRICHCESDAQNPLLTPCYCSGSLKFVHQECLQQWLTASETSSCELCKFPFVMHAKVKPFNEWRSLDMSGIERRRLFCSILFHCAIATCVIWSLCVLIERASEEVKRGLISWPFWTKLVVVTVGLTGGIVFMYIQCKAYFNLCTRWRSRNRILLIQNAPEKVSTTMHAFRESPPPPTTTTTTTTTAAFITPRRVNNLSATSCVVVNAPPNNNIYSAASQGQIVANVENNNIQTVSVCQTRDAEHLDSVIFDSELNRHATMPLASLTTIENPSPYNRNLIESQLRSRDAFNRQRHSIWMGSDCEAAELNQSNVRRYSDTRVILGSGDPYIFNVTNSLTRTQPGCSSNGGIEPRTTINIENNPEITTDILFDSAEQGSSYDPLELNIQELLELDIRTNANATASSLSEIGVGGGVQVRTGHLSVNSDPQMYNIKHDERRSNEPKNLLAPHSLPNLSASRENLLQVAQPK